MSLIKGIGNVINQLILGVAGVTTQGFVEANIKRGRQHFIIHEFANVTVGTSRQFGFTTGPSGALIKWREVTFTGSTRILYNVYEGATFTGGTPIPIRNENRVSPKTPSMQVVHTPTVSVLGSPYRPLAIYGTGADTGNANRAGTAVVGRDVFLKPSTQYVVDILNSAGVAGYIQFEVGWYEGALTDQYPFVEQP